METPISQDSPLVTIIVPVYNAEAYLHECMDSLLSQTYENLELICVDDGSRDASGDILRCYASEDERVRVICQENAGPGVARNRGIDEAQGEYLYFFDADDFCKDTLIEKAVEKLEQTQADIVTFPFEQYYQGEGGGRCPQWAFMPERFPGEVVSWRDNPDWIFRAFQNYPWNKVVRASFVRKHNLRYQEIYLTEDLMFSAPALVLAERITCLDEALVSHREGTGVNVMASKDSHPLDFLTAFLSLKAFLEERGLFEELRVAYLNWVVDGCAYNLHTMKTYEGYDLVFRVLNERGFADLGVEEADLSALQEPWYADFVREVTSMSAGEYLSLIYHRTAVERDKYDMRSFVLWRRGEEDRAWAGAELERRRVALDAAYSEISELRCELDGVRRELDALANSAEQRVGQAICRAPRAVQRTLRNVRGDRGGNGEG